MADLRVLFIGGSGVISSEASRLAVRRGIGLSVLNRGAAQLRPLPRKPACCAGISAIRRRCARRWGTANSTR